MSADSSIVTALQNYYNQNIGKLSSVYDQHPNFDLTNQIGEQYNTGVRGLPSVISSYQQTGDITVVQNYLKNNYISPEGVQYASQISSDYIKDADPGYDLRMLVNPLSPSNALTLPAVQRTVSPTVSSPVINSLTSALSSITSNSTVKSLSSSVSGISPIFLIGGVVVLFLLLRK